MQTEGGSNTYTGGGLNRWGESMDIFRWGNQQWGRNHLAGQSKGEVNMRGGVMFCVGVNCQ